MNIHGVEIQKIKQGETVDCVSRAPGRAVVRWGNDPLCADCFGEKVPHDENGAAVLGTLLAASIGAITDH